MSPTSRYLRISLSGWGWIRPLPARLWPRRLIVRPLTPISPWPASLGSAGCHSSSLITPTPYLGHSPPRCSNKHSAWRGRKPPLNPPPRKPDRPNREEDRVPLLRPLDALTAIPGSLGGRCVGPIHRARRSGRSLRCRRGIFSGAPFRPPTRLSVSAARRHRGAHRAHRDRHRGHRHAV